MFFYQIYIYILLYNNLSTYINVIFFYKNSNTIIYSANIKSIL